MQLGGSAPRVQSPAVGKTKTHASRVKGPLPLGQSTLPSPFSQLPESFVTQPRLPVACRCPRELWVRAALGSVWRGPPEALPLPSSESLLQVSHSCGETGLPGPGSEHPLPPDCDCSAAGTQGHACRKDPRVGRCVCQPNFQGAHCELCAPGFYGPGCQRECGSWACGWALPERWPGVVILAVLPAACQCSSPGVADGLCDPDSGQCRCRAGFEGPGCDRCAPGYSHFPLCQRE